MEKFECKQCGALAAVIVDVARYGLEPQVALQCQSAGCLWLSRLFENELELRYEYDPDVERPKPKEPRKRLE
jgi:hypothetical protein